MKIAHILNYPGMGGAEQYALSLAQKAKKSGHEVIFILGEDGPLIKRLRESGLKYYSINIPSFYSPGALASFKKIITKEGTEIIHTHFLREHFLAVLAKILGAKIKIIRTIHREDRFYRRVKALMPIFQNKTSGFIAISEYIKRRMSKEGIPKNKITLIYNGAAKIKTKRGKDLGYIGRLSPEKGIYHFLKENLYKIKVPFWVGGDGPDRLNIESLSKKNKNIKVLGHITDKTDFYSKISVLVLPSQTEVAPLVIYEAFSAGIPVATFKIEPLNEFINGTTGVMVEKDNYGELYQAALKLSANKNTEEEIKKEWLEKYNIDSMWQQTETLYKKTLG